MAIEKKTMLMQTEVSEGRAVTVHFMQIIFDQGKEIARSKPHTITFMPDTDANAVLEAVNRDITTREGMKWSAIEPAEWARAVGHRKIEHTPEVKAAYKAFKQAAVAPPAPAPAQKRRAGK